jgi:membrane associated rhomboid family serine protease
MVKNILLINVGIFLLQSFLNLPLSTLFGLRVVFADQFAVYQLLTYMWIHGGFGHLFGNMFDVLIFGPLLEQVWGPKRFLIFYLACGIGAGALYGVADFAESYSFKKDKEAFMQNPNPDDFSIFIVEHKSPRFNMSRIAEFSDEYYENPNDSYYENQALSIVQSMYDQRTNIPMVGASGAVFGILMAFGMLFPNTVLMLLFPPIPIKAKYLVLFYGLYELYAELQRAPGDNVAHLAHLSGMLIAFILLKYWSKKSNRFY